MSFALLLNDRSNEYASLQFFDNFFVQIVHCMRMLDFFDWRFTRNTSAKLRNDLTQNHPCINSVIPFILCRNRNIYFIPEIKMTIKYTERLETVFQAVMCVQNLYCVLQFYQK